MANSRKRALLAIGLLLLVVSAGCSGGLTGAGGDDSDGARGGDGGDGGGSGDGDGGLATGSSAGSDGDAGGDGGGSPQLALDDRSVIFTGDVTLEVDDVETARGDVRDAVRDHGGYVSDVRIELHRVDDERYRSGVVVLRVPRGNFTALMEQVEARGTVTSSDTSSEDVTDELVDIDARLSSLRAERDRLRTLFDRANETDDVLAVEARLSEVQTDIERLEARQQSLEDRVAYSTITVTLHEERPEAQAEQWYDVGVVAAFLDSIDGVGVTLRALAVAAAYAVPYLVVFGVPAAGIGLAVRWRRRDR